MEPLCVVLQLKFEDVVLQLQLQPVLQLQLQWQLQLQLQQLLQLPAAPAAAMAADAEAVAAGSCSCICSCSCSLGGWVFLGRCFPCQHLLALCYIASMVGDVAVNTMPPLWGGKAPWPDAMARCRTA